MRLPWGDHRPTVENTVNTSTTQVQEILDEFRTRWLLSQEDVDWLIGILGNFDGRMPGTIGVPVSELKFVFAAMEEGKGVVLVERLSLLFQNFCKCVEAGEVEKSCQLHEFEIVLIKLGAVMMVEWFAEARIVAANDVQFGSLPFVSLMLTFIEKARNVM